VSAPRRQPSCSLVYVGPHAAAMQAPERPPVRKLDCCCPCCCCPCCCCPRLGKQLAAMFSLAGDALRWFARTHARTQAHTPLYHCPLRITLVAATLQETSKASTYNKTQCAAMHLSPSPESCRGYGKPENIATQYTTAYPPPSTKRQEPRHPCRGRVQQYMLPTVAARKLLSP
jgi:hypothetical protein